MDGPKHSWTPAPGARNSAWSFVDDTAHAAFEAALRADLDSGVWDAHHGHLCAQPRFDGSLRLVVSRPTRD